MTNNPINDTPGAQEPAPELERVASALDALAERERSAAPAGLEDRVFVRTRGLLPHARVADDSPHADRAITPLRIEPILKWRWRLAAGIAIAAATVLIAGLIVNRSASTQPGTLADDVDSEINEFLEITSEMESLLAATDAPFDVQSVGFNDDFWGDDSDASALLEDTL